MGEPVEDEEHHTWSISFNNAQGAKSCIDWTLASSPEFRQMMSKYSLIKEFLEPPFLVEYAAKASASRRAGRRGSEAEGAEAKAETKHAGRAARTLREPVEKQTARELFAYIVSGQKGLPGAALQGAGRNDATQLWETTMDPERRTLLRVKLEDIAETDAIFTTLMGEDVEARRSSSKTTRWT